MSLCNNKDFITVIFLNGLEHLFVLCFIDYSAGCYLL